MRVRRRIAILVAATITTLGTLAGIAAPAARATFTGENRISFIRCAATCNLYSMKTNGSGQKAITHFSSPMSVEFGHLSPNAQTVVMGVYNGGGDDIYVANIDGSHLRNITKTPTADEYDPSFSPDGKKVIYIKYPSSKIGRIETRNVNGTGRKTILKNDGVDEPVFSPDGTQIATSASFPGDPDEEIYVMHADGSHLRRLTNTTGSNYMGTWSPDGSHLSWYHYTGSDGDVMTMKPDGSHSRQLTFTSTVGYAPWYTPDGGYIYFSDSTGGTYHIYVMAKNGGPAVQLTSAAADDYVIVG